MNFLENLPKIIDFGMLTPYQPSVGDRITIDFNKKFNTRPIVVVGQNGYLLKETVTSASFFIISKVTLTSFTLNVAENLPNHSPAIFWIAIE